MGKSEPDFLVSILAGGAAGTSVDVTLFPLDTLKTRLQSESGFWKSGGFRNLFSGLAPAAIASAPTAAVFFATYDGVKKQLIPRIPHEKYEPAVHMTAASCGEVMACLLRVPMEVIKQRRQAQIFQSSFTAVKDVLKNEGIRGVYRGYWSTVWREIPFSFIQFPIWEALKRQWANRLHVQEVLPWQSALCGAAAGGFSAAVTTPLDVAKTRIMLADRQHILAEGSILAALKSVHAQKGIKGLFAGVIPRTIWITTGGAVFFGMYEKAKTLLEHQILQSYVR